MDSKLLTPRQAANAVGVSESSVRRWCDQGRLRGERTAGGHRRIPLASLLEFARGNGMRVAGDGLEGARNSGGRKATIEQLRARVRQYAVSGNDLGLWGLIRDLLGSGRSIASVCDDVVAPALHAIGAEWSAGRLDVFEEHRATETFRLVLANARELVEAFDESAPAALSCSLTPDLYGIAPQMVALVVREAGFRNIHLGTNTPPESAAKAITTTKPALVVISVSSVESEDEAAQAIRALKEAASDHGALLALGGRALSEGLRRRVSADFFGDTMEHLSGFAHRVRDMAS